MPPKASGKLIGRQLEAGERDVAEDLADALLRLLLFPLLPAFLLLGFVGDGEVRAAPEMMSAKARGVHKATNAPDAGEQLSERWFLVGLCDER